MPALAPTHTNVRTEAALSESTLSSKPLEVPVRQANVASRARSSRTWMKTKTPPLPSHRQRGFGLLTFLVALALAGLVAVLLMPSRDGTSDVLPDAQTSAQATQIIDQMTAIQNGVGRLALNGVVTRDVTKGVSASTDLWNPTASGIGQLSAPAGSQSSVAFEWDAQYVNEPWAAASFEPGLFPALVVSLGRVRPEVCLEIERRFQDRSITSIPDWSTEPSRARGCHLDGALGPSAYVVVPG